MSGLSENVDKPTGRTCCFVLPLSRKRDYYKITAAGSPHKNKKRLRTSEIGWAGNPRVCNMLCLMCWTNNYGSGFTVQDHQALVMNFFLLCSLWGKG